ncbi:MAG: hypothetical protein IH623_24695 [Verrucomicrobia bacterium]|nr:hypothetical protein [Verrucomicrobiota bacterium]
MHPTTDKLITLERIEDFMTRGWRAGSHEAVSNQANALRQELPPHTFVAYNEVKARHKEVVVGVFNDKCGGCHRPLSRTTLERLSAEREVSRCEHCGRFIYLAGGHNCAPSGQSHQLMGGHGRR